ncbi:hypothetical protein [Streptomyces sp. NPDC001480]|uniref:hypothetical protein n=1 Tax=Streptomyces sp. NPDC001480 TaxID=3364577 RepID=UPI0036B21D0A
MTALRRSALALGTAVCAVAMVSGPATNAFATTEPQAPAPTQQHAVADQVSSTGPGDIHTQSYWWGTDRAAGDCKVWLNRSGKFFQMVAESWGHACTVSFARYHNGTLDLRDPRNVPSHQTISSNWYWLGSGYEVYDFVHDNTSGASNGGGPFTLG